MKREKTKLRQAVRRLSVCAARLAEEAESGAAGRALGEGARGGAAGADGARARA